MGAMFLSFWKKFPTSLCSKSNHWISRQSWTLNLEPWSRSDCNSQLNIFKDIEAAVCKVVVLVVDLPPMPSQEPLSPTCCWAVIFSTVGWSNRPSRPNRASIHSSNQGRVVEAAPSNGCCSLLLVNRCECKRVWLMNCSFYSWLRRDQRWLYPDSREVMQNVKERLHCCVERDSLCSVCLF